MAFITVNDVCIHYRTGRESRGRPVVFINSLGSDYRIWHKAAHALGGEFRKLFYDKRGHGLSDVGELPYAMADHVADLAAIMDSLEMKQAIVCGISVGGQVALGLSAARPDLVAGLVLCDTAHKIGTAEIWDKRIATVAADGIASVWPMTEKAWFTDTFRSDQADEVTGWRNMVTRCPLGGYIGTCMAIRDTDYEQAAKAISVPTLVLCGEADGSTPPALVKGMADIIPGSRYVEIENAAHMICIEQPRRVAELVRDFARENALI